MSTLTVTAGNVVRSNVSASDVWTVMEELFQLTGCVPTTTPEGDSAPAPVSVDVSVDTSSAPASAPVQEVVCKVGRERSQTDVLLAERNGFSMAWPLYDRGTVVNETGVRHARQSRQDWEALPSAYDACSAFSDKIRAEQRRDHVVSLADLRMDVNGRVGRGGRGLALTENALSNMVGRVSASLRQLGEEGLGGAGSYLRSCPPALRAQNVNHWQEKLAGLSCADQIRIRERKNEVSREVYAILSDSYTPFDADKVADAVGHASPANAKGAVTYDGQRTRIECLFHSNVQPEHFVAGEVFKAGVIVTTDDTGGGAVRASAVVWQNLCRNLILIDKASQEVVNLRHVGDAQKLEHTFRKGFREAMGKVQAFATQWDVACEDVIKPISGQQLREELIRAAIKSVIERALVPVSGRKPEAERLVFRAWQQDRSGAGLANGGLNRAALANAFTRYAHEYAEGGPWLEDEIQEAAGKLVWGRGAYRDMIA